MLGDLREDRSERPGAQRPVAWDRDVMLAVEYRPEAQVRAALSCHLAAEFREPLRELFAREIPRQPHKARS